MYLTVETNTEKQYLNQERPDEMKRYIESLGFTCDHWGQNGRFLNTKFKHLWNQIQYKFLESD